MRQYVALAATLAMFMVVVFGLTQYVAAQSPSLFMPSVQVPERINGAAIIEPAVPEISPGYQGPTLEELGPPRTTEATDLVPDLPKDQKMFVAFYNEDGNSFGFYIEDGDFDRVTELVEQYGPIAALITPQLRTDNGDPGDPTNQPAPVGTPTYTGDPDFVHPDPDMPPNPPPWAKDYEDSDQEYTGPREIR